MIRRVTLPILVLVALVATPAFAVGPTSEVVQDRLYTFGGKFDVALLAGLSINNKLTDQYAILVQPAYQLTDAWGLQIDGGFVLAQEKTKLTNPIRANVFALGLHDEFSNMGTMQWIAQGALRWSPIYGKLSLAAELPIHFGAYVSLGGGFVGVHRVSLVDCQGGSNCRVDTGAKPSGAVAVGLRFYIARWFALRVELKDILFPDSYKLGVGTSNVRTASGLTGVLLFNAGASFYF